MERTDPFVLSENWRQKKRRFLIIRNQKLCPVQAGRVGKRPIVGIYTKYYSTSLIKFSLEVYKFGNSLRMIVCPLEDSSIQSIVENKLPEKWQENGYLESIQVQFGGRAYDLVLEEGVRFEVRGNRLIIRLCSLHKTIRKFVI